MMLTNVRTPTHNRGDIEAMIAACELGKRRLLELLGRYGKEAVLGAARVTGSTTRSGCCARRSPRCRTASTRRRSATSTTTGRTAEAPPVKVKVIIEGDSLTIDVTGSSDEVETAFNSPYEGAVVSAATYIVRTIFLDEATYDVFVPQNEGMLRPVSVIAPRARSSTPTSRARRRRASARCSGWPTSPCRRSRP